MTDHAHQGGTNAYASNLGRSMIVTLPGQGQSYLRELEAIAFNPRVGVDALISGRFRRRSMDRITHCDGQDSAISMLKAAHTNTLGRQVVLVADGLSDELVDMLMREALGSTKPLLFPEDQELLYRIAVNVERSSELEATSDGGLMVKRPFAAAVVLKRSESLQASAALVVDRAPVGPWRITVAEDSVLLPWNYAVTLEWQGDGADREPVDPPVVLLMFENSTDTVLQLELVSEDGESALWYAECRGCPRLQSVSIEDQ